MYSTSMIYGIVVVVVKYVSFVLMSNLNEGSLSHSVIEYLKNLIASLITRVIELMTLVIYGFIRRLINSYNSKII